MTDVTDADRERAAKLWQTWIDAGNESMDDIIAAALAEERANARAPFLTLADEAAREQGEIAADLHASYGVRFRWDIADRIRRAAEEIQ